MAEGNPQCFCENHQDTKMRDQEILEKQSSVVSPGACLHSQVQTDASEFLIKSRAATTVCGCTPASFACCGQQCADTGLIPSWLAPTALAEELESVCTCSSDTLRLEQACNLTHSGLASP